MASPLRFSDHTAFHGQVIRMSFTGAGLALVNLIIFHLTSTESLVQTMLLGALSAATLGLSALPPRRGQLLWPCVSAFGIALLAALCMQAALVNAPRYPWLAIGLYGASLGIIAGRDLRGRPRLLLPLATALSVTLGSFVIRTFRADAFLLEYVPELVAEVAYGALYGFIASTGLVLRQLRSEQDHVQVAYDEVKPTLAGETAQLASQGMGLYDRVQQVLRDRSDRGDPVEPKIARAVEQLVLRIIDTARQWTEVERGAGQTDAAALAERIAALGAKVDGTQDDVARRQYAQAKTALQTQLRYLEDISKNRERVTARMHNYLATLERLHLSIWNLRGSDAAKLSETILPILDELDTCGAELDYSRAAIDEVVDATEGRVDVRASSATSARS